MITDPIVSRSGWSLYISYLGGLLAGLSMALMPPYSFAIPLLLAAAVGTATKLYKHALEKKRNALINKYGDKKGIAEREKWLLLRFDHWQPYRWYGAVISFIVGVACAALWLDYTSPSPP